MSTLSHNCGFACQQRVLKTFPGPSHLRSEDGVVRLWDLLVNIYIHIFDEHEEKDYYKPEKVDLIYSNNFIIYACSRDKIKTLSIEEYLNKIKLYLKKKIS